MFHGIQFALKMIKKRPLRMGLTLFQVAVGVAAIAIVLSFIFSVLMSNSHDKQIYEVRAGVERSSDGSSYRSFVGILTKDIIDYLKSENQYFGLISIIKSRHGGFIEDDGIVYRYRNAIGVESDYLKIRDLKIINGNFFTQADVENHNSVVIISEDASKQLFGTENPIGKKLNQALDTSHQGQIEIVNTPQQSQTQAWEIIGVFEKNNNMGNPWTIPDFIIPYTNFSANDKYIDSFIVSIQPGKITEAKEELIMLFNHKKGELRAPEYLSDINFEDLTLMFEKEQAFDENAKKSIVKTFGLFLGSFAFIALVISSIGILSTMLVSIVERTREIGLRRALGASRMSIMRQILIESIIISFIGGILGIIIAFFTVKPIINGLLLKVFYLGLLGIEANLSLYSALISLCSVIIIGILAGFYPGIQASRLTPVDAIKEG